MRPETDNNSILAIYERNLHVWVTAQQLRAILLLLFSFLNLMGLQSQTIPNSKEWSRHFGYLSINPARPGFNFGFEYGIAEKTKLKTKVIPGKGGQNHVKVNQLMLGANLGVIWHPHTSVSFLNTYTLEARRTTKRKLQYQIGLGPGYFHSIYGPTYMYEKGTLKEKAITGKGYFAPNSFVGLGVFRRTPHTLQWVHLRLISVLLINYNGFVNPLVLGELRLGFHKKPIEQ